MVNKITHIRKRDGSTVLFDENRIESAISKAFAAVKKEGDYKKLKEMVVKQLNATFRGSVPSVEDIQDVVEKVLITVSDPEVAKTYIVYRKEHQDIRNLHESLMNVGNVMDGYLEQADWRVQENSNVNYSVAGMMLHAAGSVINV